MHLTALLQRHQERRVVVNAQIAPEPHQAGVIGFIHDRR
jgi:hypothetical protein